jgi:type IV secretory pathway TrbF-like protein
MHGGRVAPWILARAVADGTDAGAIAIALASGARSTRFVILGAIALAATIADLMIYRANRSIAVAGTPTESSPG